MTVVVVFFINKTTVLVSVWLFQPAGNNCTHNDTFSIFYSLCIGISENVDNLIGVES